MPAKAWEITALAPLSSQLSPRATCPSQVKPGLAHGAELISRWWSRSGQQGRPAHRKGQTGLPTLVAPGIDRRSRQSRQPTPYLSSDHRPHGPEGVRFQPRWGKLRHKPRGQESRALRICDRETWGGRDRDGGPEMQRGRSWRVRGAGIDRRTNQETRRL